ncbi:YadA-like protein [Pantoea sp. PNA 14-12]|uniref:YadA C-terminal domain-containing protein n=1 Tax=Pantoea TaxID=53335 RepID=UPI00105FC1DA|nr:MULTISPECIES: YadA-like family protein [Pantoea]TDS67718.1 YadA-like protein [Pantoea sp. PNA 14-12]
MKLKTAMPFFILCVSVLTPAYADILSIFRPSEKEKPIEQHFAEIDTSAIENNIHENAASIETNKKNIFANADDIESNRDNISTNTAEIETNQKNIRTNAADIQTNKQSISTNAAGIEANKEEIGANIARTEANRNDINHNRSAIAVNHEATLHNHELITDNTHAIQTVTSQLSTFKFEAESRFSNIENDIRKNDKKAMAGISAAMAMNAIPFIEGKNVSMGLSGGSYGGQSALAWGSIFKLGDNVRSGTYLSYDTSRNLGVAAGLSVGW